MKSFLDKILFRSNNLENISSNIKNFTKKTSAEKIFDVINNYSKNSEIRYVGGLIRKIINEEIVNDIDLATNLEPKEICKVLKENRIDFYETGIEHGTITALLNQQKFEITTLRKDISTDGRHAKVEFSKDWKIDASRRDFTINSIYSDKDGNLFDPFNGIHDLKRGLVNFIGDADKRIKEDYLRILRYIRFFLEYSKLPHNLELIKKLKINIGGISKLSKDRLLNELRKIAKLNSLEKLSKDKISQDLILMIFPELKNIKIFSKLDTYKKKILNEMDFIFLLSLMIIDGSDNVDYFFYKFNISKKDQKRIKILDNFYKDKINSKTFTENSMNRMFYYEGRQAIIDVLKFRIIKLKKFDKNLFELVKLYEKKTIPVLPIKTEVLMKKYHLSEGHKLGTTLKIIEEEWIKNNFQISDKQIDYIVKN